MAEPDSEEIIGTLKRSLTPTDQLTALKRLQNSIIGHLEKKESFVQAGLIDVLIQLLKSSDETITRHRSQNTNGSHAAQTGNGWSLLDDFQELQSRALTVLASIAQGGVEFIYPLRAASVEQILLGLISPKNNQAKVVCAALKAAVNVLHAEDFNISPEESTESPNNVWASLEAAQSYQEILSQTTNSSAVRTQVSYVCQILQSTLQKQKKTRQSERDHHLLCSAGIIDCLATHLSSFYIHHHPKSSKAFNTVLSTLPAPPSAKTFPDVLGAINALVEGSRYRVARLLLSPTIFAVLPFYNSQLPVESRIHQTTQYATYDINPTDLAVPWIHNGIQQPTDSKFSHFQAAFPALGMSQAKQTFVDFADTEKFTSSTGAGVDSALTVWLMHLVRTASGLTCARAANLIATIAKADFICKSKSYTLALVVIPVLLNMLRAPNLAAASSAYDPLRQAWCQHTYETPMALAALLDDASALGHTMLKHAVEANIIFDVCRFLKQTFATIENKAPFWSVNPSGTHMEQDIPASYTLGHRGVSSRVAFYFKCRSAGLDLVAAIGGNRPGEDKFRKMLVENGAVQCILDSLPALNADSMRVLQSHGGKEKMDASVGNPFAVILSACKATTAISRSIFLLRTSLIDAGLAKPIYALTQLSDAIVLPAAIGAICNLLIECSPMREDLTKAGAIKVLCMHAKCSDPRIRAVALWAIKHVISQAPINVKKECLETLGAQWLMQVIDGAESVSFIQSCVSGSTSNTSIGAASNAFGERVSILHTFEEDEKMQVESTVPFTSLQLDTEKPQDALSERVRAYNQQVESKDPQHLNYLGSIKASEEAERAREPMRRALQMQIVALDVLRNTFCAPGQHEMLDWFYDQVSSSKLYSSLTAKLQPQQLESDASLTRSRLDTAALKIVDTALKTVCHIAAGAPRHRREMIEQTALLRHVLSLFRHSNSEIRSTCCWVCTNLVWVEDGDDQQSAKERALVLKRMGVEKPLEELSRRAADGGRESSQDVRERAAAARDALMHALEGRPSRGNGEPGLGHMPTSAEAARAR